MAETQLPYLEPRPSATANGTESLTLKRRGDSIALVQNHTLSSEASMNRKSSTRKNDKRQPARPIFDSIRKPTAPPGHPLSRAKPDEIARPAGRKAKHKTRPEVNDDEPEN
ncbi:MAG TPA: hypothetical protein VL866_11305 [Pyrinomonadaceae bacterium]|nr:hypothetical protein [Pyrinomonadaceae bacterium]